MAQMFDSPQQMRPVLLHASRLLKRDGAAWIRLHEGENKRGSQIDPCHEDCVKFCVMGSIRRSVWTLFPLEDGRKYPDANSQEYMARCQRVNEILQHLAQEFPSVILTLSLADWNDYVVRSGGSVVSLLDSAAHKLEAGYGALG